MSRLGPLLVKVGVFAGAAALSFVVATVALAALQDRSPVSSVTAAPAYLLAGSDTPAGPGPVVAFNEVPSGDPSPLPTLSPEELDAAAAALLGGTAPAATTTKVVNPSGFPRIPPITQFDGGPFQGSNCTLASGAMLARLASGIRTTGSVLRTLQDDQVGGTDPNDLAQALWRGYGVSYAHGLIRPDALKRLLASGYGAVVQGIYGEIPTQLRLQKSFTGGHAVYLDGYYPGDAARGIPEAYYVIDPIGRPRSGYEGAWWPAVYVDKFTRAWSGDRVVAMWAFPPGGTPPDVVGPDVLPIVSSGGGGGGGGASGSPEPGASPSESPSESPSAAPSGGPVGPVLGDPGDTVLVLDPPKVAPVTNPSLGGLVAAPIFDVCLITPTLAGCPSGLEAIFDTGPPPLAQLKLGPTVTVLFTDSDRPNTAIVGFTVDPPATADVKFWEQGASPAAVLHASAMSSMPLFGGTVQLAQLDVKAGTTYHFQVAAGNGLFGGTSDIGTFTTGSGVEQFDVALAQAASPVFKLEAGLSPYLHPAPGAFAQPLIKVESLGGSCTSPAQFGGASFCLDPAPQAVTAASCTTADVSWTLSGIDADGVLVDAFPVDKGVTPGGSMTLDGVIEVSGPAPSGTASVGCLASGMTYDIAIDAVGDDRGILATKTITVP